MTRCGCSAALAVSLTIALTLGMPLVAEARITRVEIVRTESPALEGASFGAVGKYEKLVGRAFGEVDPNDPRNAVIVDIQLAPRNARGMVEYSTDIYLLRPIDSSKGNHRLLFDINNRGNGTALGEFNDAAAGNNDPTKAADVGNGFLMRQGYTLLWSGWDADVSAGNGRFTIKVPIARHADGSSIVGPALEEFVIDGSTTLTGELTYPAATLDTSKASLTVRVRYEDVPKIVPAASWEYGSAHGIRLLPAGTPFKEGSLYEFVYPAKDPKVSGLGFAAIRDVAMFVRQGGKGDQASPNPLAQDVQSVYSVCGSQSCRTMHDFLWWGFNQGETGQRAFDGILNWVGGGSGIFMNYRFAQTGRTQRQHIARWFPEYQFPFTNQVMTDPHTGKTDGRLRRCLESHTCPNVLEVNSENEYWSKGMSVFQLDGHGKDLAEPNNVRYFLMSSLPHGAGTNVGMCQQPRNPLNANPVLRALLVVLDRWTSAGEEPPASRMPRRADGTLVQSMPQSEQGFPQIPGVKYNGRIHTGDRLDFGEEFDQGILTHLPPALLGSPYPSLVPKTDADGNDMAGVRLPDVAAPLATYTGWALRANGGDDGCDGAGQKIDFARTKADRLSSGDPRPSIEERYPNHEAYVGAVTRSADDLYRQRLLLEEDVHRYVDRAARSDVGK